MKEKKLFVSITSGLVFFSMLMLMLWLVLSLSRIQELVSYLLFFSVVLIAFVYYRDRAQRVKGSFFVSVTDILLVLVIVGGLLMTGFTMEDGQIAQVLGNTDSKMAVVLIGILAMTCINGYDT